LILLVLIALLAIDAYAYSGAFTQAAVHEVTAQVQKLASRIDAERPTPPRPIPDRGAG
jgi:hypothetical protein